MAVAMQNPLNIPGPPTLATVAEERQHRKQHLAGAFRLFSRFGFDEGVAGPPPATPNTSMISGSIPSACTLPRFGRRI
jgi:hypothetical protein